MDWFKKHTDAILVLTAVATSMIWMNGRFNEVEKRFNELEKDIVMIKTVMLLKNIMPPELVKSSDKE
jgi:hypothetical protein